eukprot:1100323-Pelagomonas_calceolata.AAC.4
MPEDAWNPPKADAQENTKDAEDEDEESKAADLPALRFSDKPYPFNRALVRGSGRWRTKRIPLSAADIGQAGLSSCTPDFVIACVHGIDCKCAWPCTCAHSCFRLHVCMSFPE